MCVCPSSFLFVTTSVGDHVHGVCLFHSVVRGGLLPTWGCSENVIVWLRSAFRHSLYSADDFSFPRGLVLCLLGIRNGK